MRTFKAAVLSLGLAAAVSSSAAAQTMGFDDITASPTAWITSYGGLNWSNAFVRNGVAHYGSVAAAGGFNTATQSGSYVLANGGGSALSLSSSSSPFNLLGGVFAAAWTNGLTVQATGYVGGSEVYSKSFLVDWDKAQYVDLGMYGVDNVVFSSTNGTVDALYPWDSNQGFVADNLEFSQDDGSVSAASVSTVPEPMTMGMMGFGLLAVGVVARRRKTIA